MLAGEPFADLLVGPRREVVAADSAASMFRSSSPSFTSLRNPDETYYLKTCRIVIVLFCYFKHEHLPRAQLAADLARFARAIVRFRLQACKKLILCRVTNKSYLIKLFTPFLQTA